MHKKFHLYKRETKKGVVYYVKFYDEYGNRMPGRSSGMRSKAAAETWAFAQLKEGIVPTQKDISFGKYAEH